MNNLKSWYLNILKTDFIYKTNFLNPLQIPKINNTNININSKSIIENQKSILYSIIALKLISNQNPTINKAKKSIAVLKIRKGTLIGSRVTLRKKPSYNFLSLFIFLVMPNIKAIKNLNVTKGSLSIGIKNLLVFPQLNECYDRFPNNINCIVNINCNIDNIQLSKILFSGFQIPIK